MPGTFADAPRPRFAPCRCAGPVEQLAQGMAEGWQVRNQSGTFAWSAFAGGSMLTGTAPTRLAAEFAARNALGSLKQGGPNHP